jgi:multidrug efflux pump subunit AcrA (membrane-fusion protein)
MRRLLRDRPAGSGRQDRSCGRNKGDIGRTSANVKRLEAIESFKNIVAPFDGIVMARKTDIGAQVNAGNGAQELFEVSDLHKVLIYVQVRQAFTAEVQPGWSRPSDIPKYPGQQFDAKVVTASNAMEVNSRSMLIEVQADNADGKLFAGAYCQVHFPAPE